MSPPGIPDWITRLRFLRVGPVDIVGRAWSGSGTGISRVEFSAGKEWVEAKLVPGNGKYAWTKWSVTWDATPGEYVLKCRATDENGNIQPIEPVWDVAGFGNNAVQSVRVLVGHSAHPSD